MMRNITEIHNELNLASTELGTVNKRIAELKTELRNAKKREASPTRLVDKFNAERAQAPNPFDAKQS